MTSSFRDAIVPNFTSLNKKNILKSVSYLYGSLEMETLPALKIYLDSNVSAINKSKFLSSAFKMCNLSGNNNKCVKSVYDFFIEISNSEKTVTKLCHELNDVLLDKVTSIKDAAIIRVIQDFSFLNLYVLDMLYMALIENGETTFPKKKIDKTKEIVHQFAILFNYYNKKIDKILEDIVNLPTININTVESESGSMLDNIISKFKFINVIPATDGFIHNPIFHFRMWLVDREINKYEALKDRKKEIELRLLELRYQDEGGNDPKLREQIEYFEDKLANTEYKINKIEND